jgi:hypothetical protein
MEKHSNNSHLPWLVVASGGTIESSFLPYRLFQLRVEYQLTLACALSRGALDFVTPVAMQAISGFPVYQEGQRFHPLTSEPMHLALQQADFLLIYPASARLLAQMAMGEVTCPVTRLFAFFKKSKVMIASCLHPAMENSLYTDHINRLRGLGCTVVADPLTLTCSWGQIQQALVQAMNLQPQPPASLTRLEQMAKPWYPFQPNSTENGTLLVWYGTELLVACSQTLRENLKEFFINFRLLACNSHQGRT